MKRTQEWKSKVPETIWLTQGSRSQEATVTEACSGNGTGDVTRSEWLCPSRNTGQGAVLCGKPKRLTRGGTGKPNPVHYRRPVGTNNAAVPQYMPEAGRS